MSNQPDRFENAAPFIWPAYPFEDWGWDEMEGWFNPEDDPASPTETLLLNEIERLRAIENDVIQHLPLILACAKDFDTRLPHGIGSLPEWMYQPPYWVW